MPTAAVPTDLSAPSDALLAKRDRSAPQGLRGRLRHATADAHARLDGRLVDFDLTRRPDYHRFLEASAAALLPLEAALVDANVVRMFPDWPQRSRGRAIRQDLARLGGEFFPLATPGQVTADGVLGTMYVLEGSGLGARVLLGTVARTPDPVVASATAYLRHGAGLALWPSFLATLERHGATANAAAVVNAALTAFALFDAAFARVTAGSRSFSRG